MNPPQILIEQEVAMDARAVARFGNQESASKSLNREREKEKERVVLNSIIMYR